MEVLLVPKPSDDLLGENIILEEILDKDYKHTNEDILEYAKYLGMDLDEDQDLLWIAKKALKQPLPPSWKPCQSKTGEIFYFNFNTGKRQNEHPIDEIFKEIYQQEKKSKTESQELEDDEDLVDNEDLTDEIRVERENIEREFQEKRRQLEEEYEKALERLANKNQKKELESKKFLKV